MRSEPKPARAHSWVCGGERNEEMRKWSASYKLAPEEVNFAKVSNFGKVCVVKSDILEDSEDIGEVRKRAERSFDEKRV